MSGVYKYSTKAGDRWRIVYDGPPTVNPETGATKRRQVQRRGSEREKNAKRALRDALGDTDVGTHVPADRITVAAYVTDEWLPSIRPRGAADARRHRGTVSIATHDRYARDLKRYVLPRIGAIGSGVARPTRCPRQRRARRPDAGGRSRSCATSCTTSRATSCTPHGSCSPPRARGRARSPA